MVFHLFQADQFHRAIASGTLLPHWAISANNGYGAPNFIFYAPLSYYLSSLIRAFTTSPVTSIIIAIWCGFFLSGASMYLSVQRISGNRGALPAAVLYQLLPFHLLNLYGRGAFAELTAYTWFPLVILFMHESLSEKRTLSAFAGLSLSYAGLILTHLVSAFMFTLMLLLYMTCHYFYQRSVTLLLRAASALTVGLGISSFYLLPAIFERKYVQMEYMFNYVFSDYRRNFLFLKNNFDTPFHIALHGAVVLETILFLTVVALILRYATISPMRPHQKAICLIFGVALFLTTPLAAPFWRHVPCFAILQFPWRWLSVMELTLCFLVASAISGGAAGIFPNFRPPGRIMLYAIAALLSVSFLLIIRSGRMYTAPFLAGITDPEKVTRYTNLPKEYTPVWAVEMEKSIKEMNEDKVAALSGEAGIRILEWEPERRVIAINASQPAMLRIATFYYPGWEARVDRTKTDIIIEQKSGAMLVSAPTGEHTLKLNFGDTSLRAFSRYLSFGSCAILGALALFMQKRTEACRNQ
jgi:hypothetical protein